MILCFSADSIPKRIPKSAAKYTRRSAKILSLAKGGMATYGGKIVGSLLGLLLLREMDDAVAASDSPRKAEPDSAATRLVSGAKQLTTAVRWYTSDCALASAVPKRVGGRLALLGDRGASTESCWVDLWASGSAGGIR